MPMSMPKHEPRPDVLSKEILELLLADAVHEILDKERRVWRQIFLGHHHRRPLDANRGCRLGRAVDVARRELPFELLLLLERVVEPRLAWSPSRSDRGSAQICDGSLDGWDGNDVCAPCGSPDANQSRPHSACARPHPKPSWRTRFAARGQHNDTRVSACARQALKSKSRGSAPSACHTAETC